MDKVKLLFNLAEDLRKLADDVVLVAGAIQEADEPAETPQASLEEVRAVLADKSRAGMKDKVKELLMLYGADKLSDVDPKQYGLLMRDAKGLGDGK